MKQGHGVMINVSSTAVVVGYDKGAPYTLGKSAVLGLTKHIAQEYGKYGIRSNAIAPGPCYAEKLGKVIQSRKTEHGLRHIPWQA
jgi:NAD(P)-dependent dehydrogenase (short-subunit alcohol dehydrogenase family)